MDAASAAADHSETAVAACDDHTLDDCVDAASAAADHSETAVAACDDRIVADCVDAAADHTVADLSSMTIASRSSAAAYCCCWSWGVLYVAPSLSPFPQCLHLQAQVNAAASSKTRRFPSNPIPTRMILKTMFRAGADLVGSFGIIGSGSFAIEIQMGAAASMMRLRAMRILLMSISKAAAVLVISLGAVSISAAIPMGVSTGIIVSIHFDDGQSL